VLRKLYKNDNTVNWSVCTGSDCCIAW